MSSKIIMTVGLPASGKTTWARKQVDKYPNEVMRVNKDDLRVMLHNGEHSKGREQFVLAVRDRIIEAALESKKSVIVDDTNLHPKHESRLREIAEQHGVSFEINDSFLDVYPDECIVRDLRRGEKVGRGPIMSMYHKFVTPRLQQKRNQEAKKNLPPAVIVDIDGTIAISTGRSPFDYARVTEDGVNKTVVSLLSSYVQSNEGVKVFFLSGRENLIVKLEDGSETTTHELTEQWLQDNVLPYLFPDLRVAENYELYLREGGDHRKDSVVKREMYDQHIDGKYDVKFILDDREQVVNMWRGELGLLVLDVAGHVF